MIQSIVHYATTWLGLRLDRRGATALEYAVIAGVIVATLIIGFKGMETNLSNKFANIGGSL